MLVSGHEATLFPLCLAHGSSWRMPYLLAHTPSIAFRHLPPNSARFSYATEGALFTYAQLSMQRCGQRPPKGSGTDMTVEATKRQSCEPVWPSGKVGKRKDLGSIPLRLSFLFKKVVVCGHCPVKRKMALIATQLNAGIILVVTV